MGRLKMRKNVFQDLVGTSEAGPAEMPAMRRSITRGVGVVGAMSEALGTMVADAKEAKERITTGEIVVEIQTDLIEPSFITDRMGVDDEMDDFISVIREQGQRSPILLRPHPGNPERYQIAFGHRRYRAAIALGRPVKALVKPLTDDELVVAQGQENKSRLDLSYIERSLFAARLEAKLFLREVTGAAVGVDKSELSRMISVAKALPAELIEAIGPARRTGRRKWAKLAKEMESVNWEVESDRVLMLSRQSNVTDSDQRFDSVLRGLINHRTNGAEKHKPETTTRFKVDKKKGIIQIKFDETSLPKEVLDDLLGKVQQMCNEIHAETKG
jgi:ParB family chromosome partitioning protein